MNQQLVALPLPGDNALWPVKSGGLLPFVQLPGESAVVCVVRAKLGAVGIDVAGNLAHTVSLRSVWMGFSKDGRIMPYLVMNLQQRRERGNHMDMHDLSRYVEGHGIDAEILELDEPTPTVEAAAAAIGSKPAQIVKSVLFVVKQRSGEMRPLLVITNGTDRIDYVALARYAGTSRRAIRMASAEQVLELTGFPVGTVPPFGHKTLLPTVIDEGVLQQETIYGGGGALNALMRISVDELCRVLATAPVRALTQSVTTS